jgi:Malectin domain/IPT/TIG domain
LDFAKQIVSNSALRIQTPAPIWSHGLARQLRILHFGRRNPAFMASFSLLQPLLHKLPLVLLLLFVSPVCSQTAVTINAGSSSDPDDIVTASRKFSRSMLAIANTDDDVTYSTHRYAPSFTYSIPVSEGSYDVTLGFAEIYVPNCVVGGRVFDVSINNGTGGSVKSFDVYDAAGGVCNSSVTQKFDSVEVGTEGVLLIALKASVQNAFISFINVSLPNATATSVPPSSSSFTAVSSSVVSIDAGSAADPGQGVTVVGGSKFKIFLRPIGNTLDDTKFVTHRFGSKFSYSIDVPVGTYTVVLGFAETIKALCVKGGRVFSISVNGKLLPGASAYDAFEEAGGCNTAVFKMVSDVQVTAASGPITIEFTAIHQNAFVSSIDVNKVSGTDEQCVPVSTGGGTGSEDHLAHAVTGDYPARSGPDSPNSYIDADGDGVESVTIDGKSSHSHFIDSSDPDNILVGSITSFKWFDASSGELLSTDQSFTKDFPLGSTRLKLQVTDNVCDVAEAETTVTVTGSSIPGVYCYYYEMGTAFVGKDLLTSSVKPMYSVKLNNISAALPVPPGFGSTAYVVRCQFFYMTDAASEETEFTVSTNNSGEAKVFRENDMFLMSTGTMTTAVAPVSVGLSAFEIQYTRTDTSADPSLSLTVNGTSLPASALSFDVNTVLPIITSISPDTSSPEGGSVAIVSGFGFFLAPTVKFGSLVPVEALPAELSPSSFLVTIPPSKAGMVMVTVSTPQSASSNALKFTFSNSSVPIAFSKKTVVESKGGGTALSDMASSIAVWGDSWYMGSRTGTVTKLVVNADLTVTARCKSGPFPDDEWVAANGTDAPTSILGIAFSPTDIIGEPYISVSNLFWEFSNVDNPSAWRNGRIERLTPGGGCLVKKERVVSYLPVGNRDHSVNGMTFAQNGDLLIAVGGMTNQGLPGKNQGNRWETPLSAAIVRAKLSLGASFDGSITYSSDILKSTKVNGGDVDLYATGLRNPFGVTLTSQGEVFATDNGANSGDFGDAATECNEDDQGIEINVPGAPNVKRNDKVVKIMFGGFYGHANLNREQCAWIDPEDNLDEKGRAPPANYVPPLTLLPSSIDGIMEYTAAHFNSMLKGELIISSYAPNAGAATYRMEPNGSPVALDSQWSDLSVAQGFYGEIIFPRVGVNEIRVLQPSYTFPNSLSARVVTPFRGGKAGGLVITVTGHGFGAAPVVSIDGKPCPVIDGSVTETSRGSILKCTTPAASGGAELVDVSVTSEGLKSTLSNGFYYSLSST